MLVEDGKGLVLFLEIGGTMYGLGDEITGLNEDITLLKDRLKLKNESLDAIVEYFIKYPPKGGLKTVYMLAKAARNVE